MIRIQSMVIWISINLLWIIYANRVSTLRILDLATRRARGPGTDRKLDRQAKAEAKASRVGI